MPAVRLGSYFRVATLALAVPACSHDWQSLSEPSQGGGPVGASSGGGGNGSSQAGAGGAPGGSGGAGASGGLGHAGAGNGNGSTSTSVGSGGSSPTCDDSFADCESCAKDCAANGPCDDDFEDCASEDGCIDILTCIDFSCNSLKQAGCVAVCMRSGSLDAQSDLEDLIFCTHCQSCPNACEADINCDEWD
jgi:hypothetical protein